MSAMEGMIRTLLKAMDVDVEDVKAEVTRRIGVFEQNINTLNETLIIIMATQARMERNQQAIASALNVTLEPIPAPPAQGKSNGNGNTLLTSF